MVLVLGIVNASLKILGIGIGVKKVVLLMSVVKAHTLGIMYYTALSIFHILRAEFYAKNLHK